jgi:F420H(2)-dependent quinone reductase
VRRLLNALSPIPFPAWFMRLGGRLNTAWLRAVKGRGPLSSGVVILTTRGRPHVTAETQGALARCRAHVLDDEEAADLWPFLDEAYSGFRRYRTRTSRPIPIVELVPDGVGAESAKGAA